MTTTSIALPPITGPFLEPGPLPGDFYSYGELLSTAEREALGRLREFLRTEAAPIVDDYWTRAEFPFELVDGFAQLGLSAWFDPDSPEQKPSNLMSGFTAMELAHADASLATFFGVHTGLGAGTINGLGSDEQRRRWLPAMSRMEKIGAFALTEPHGGSDVAGGLETTARRDGDEWVLNGTKRWIGNATFADLVIVWARDTETNHVLGFVVEKGTPGLHGDQDREQDRAADRPERRHRARGLPRARRQPPRERDELQGHLHDPPADPSRRRLGVSRSDARGLRDRPRLREGARAVRTPDRKVPAGPGPAREDARQRDRLASE